MTTTSSETSHPARQPFRQGLPLAQIAGDRAELLPALSPAASLRETVSHWWLTNQLWISWTLLIVPLVLELIYGTFLIPYLVLAPISILATYLIYRSVRVRLHAKTKEVEALSELHLATAEALATAIDAKDQTTHCHVRRVQIYAAGMGEVFGLSANDIAALKAGALLHDIGKLAVPPHILNKPGPLTPAEFEKMKIHTVVGAEILGRVEFPYPVIPIIRHHHEQWDGRGYPDKLRGEQIPMTARIISVVDCFDSVREDRPFRRGMTLDEAEALLRRGAGIHFDPVVVEQFIKHLPVFNTEIERLGLQHQPANYSNEAPIQLSEVDMIQTRERGSFIAYDQIKKAHREVYALYEIARTFGTSLDVEHTLEILVDKVGHVVPFDTCVVFFYDENKGYATARHVVGKNAQKLATRSIALGEGVTGFALANRSPVNQLHPSLDFTDINPEAGIKYRSMASLPLFKEDVLLGALSVYSTELEQYTNDHMRLLETVTRLASDALGNAMQHAEAESNALTDQLTGLPNARYLALRFDEEAARARRTDRPFQVVMLDLDEFKNVNDTYGHKAGDKMLREVAHIIEGQLREYDFLARYGGDEFVALVQEVVGAQVEELCARIEGAVSKFSLALGRSRSARVGISVGTATFGIDGETLDQLVIAADNQMYRMKSNHRLLLTKPSADYIERAEISV
jgi:diguanylate cyclase (GGDEF)-like protein/putative nucleotidyltransferase with HDIG domain